MTPDRPAGLDAQTRSLVHVVVAVATGDTDALKARVLAARAHRVPDRWVDKLLLNLRSLHPALEALVVVDAYGKLIGRDGLDLKRRELCTLAEIAVLDTPRQLHAHLRGALNTGWTPAEVDDVLALVEQDIGAERALRVWELWAEVRDKNFGKREAGGGK